VLAAAEAVAALHLALIAFVLTGSVLALRAPRLLRLHAPVALLVLAVNVTGQPCPLTVWEVDLRASAGAPVYEDGFIDHYLLEPSGAPDVHTAAAQMGIYAVALLPNLVGYGLHAAHGLRTGRQAGRRAG